MEIDKKSSKPLYIQVADYLRNGIYSEEWGEDEQIPSENQIMMELGISRGSVKKAVGLLVKEGLLNQVQGKGTYVTRQKMNYPLGSGLISFAEALEGQELSYQTKVLDSRILQASREIASRLNIGIGADYLYIKRLRYVDNEKVMLIENRLNHRLCPGIEDEDLENESLFRLIEKLSRKKITHSESRYAARIMGEERGKVLDVPAESPVLHLEQLVYLEGNLPIEFGNVWLKSNKYYLGTMLQREEL